MKTLRFVLPLLAIIFCLNDISAQSGTTYNIKGVVVDSLTGKPVAFATVALTDGTKSIKAAATNDQGKFSLTYNKAGKYKMQTSFVGYNTMTMPVELASQKSIDLGNLSMSSGVAIGEVVVIGQLIINDIDKTVYNTAADPETPSLTALELIRKVPMLTVDGEDNIELKGQDNFKILINGKSSNFISKNYKEVLRSMPASTIKNVEVITNPPAKYDAEGLAGIINIVTTRKTTQHYSGMLSGRINTDGQWSGAGNIASSMGKFNLSANYSYSRYPQPTGHSRGTTNKYIGDEPTHSMQYGENNFKGRFQRANVEVSYEIDTFNLITAAVAGSLNRYDVEGVSKFENFNSADELIHGYNTISSNLIKPNDLEASIDWQRSFKKRDKTLTASYKIESSLEKSTALSDRIGINDYPDRNQRTFERQTESQHTFQLDYFDPINKKHTIEAGAKMTMRPNTSHTVNELMTEDEWIEELDRRNDLDYTQYIAAAYAGYRFNVKKFSVKAGVRGEMEISTGEFDHGGELQSVFSRIYNIVPNLSTFYKLTASKTIRLGYTQRIRRPSVWNLDTYVNDTDPFNISTGNANLRSEIRHSFDMGFNSNSKKVNYGINIGYNFSDNAIERVTEINNEGVKRSTFENCGLRRNFSTYIFGGINLLEGKMRINANTNLNYIVNRSKLNSNLDNRGFSYSLGGSFYAQTWKNANVNFNGNYSSPRVRFQSKSNSYYYMSLSLSQSFLKDKKLKVNLIANNPFTKNRTFSSNSFGDGYDSTNEYWVRARSATLSVQWNFGKSKSISVKKAARSIEGDEKTSKE